MKKREERDREYTLLYPRVDLLVMALLLGDPLPEMDTRQDKTIQSLGLEATQPTRLSESSMAEEISSLEMLPPHKVLCPTGNRYFFISRCH